MLSINSDPWANTSTTRFEEIAATYGTPFYLYDADDINTRIQSVRQALGGLVRVYYAVKANPNFALLRAIRNTADGLDISSGGELEQALLAGYEPATLSFAGPAKTNAELITSISKGVGYISIESVRELRECIRIARQLGSKASIAVRVNPQTLNPAFGMKMGGRSIQFGVDEEEIHDILSMIGTHVAELDFQGIHVYAGSQCFEASGIVEGVENTLGIVREIERRSPLMCRVINFGGGFGLSHVQNNKEINLSALAVGLTPVLRTFIDSSPIPRKLVFELGRFLAAHAGIYVVRVISSKESRGKKFFMMDGGLNHHLAAAGTFGAALRSNFVLRNLTHPDATLTRCNIAGPSCNPTDLLGIDVELPKPELGDLIGVLRAGAYGLTASPVLFLGRQTPAELVQGQGAIVVGRRAHPMTDFN